MKSTLALGVDIGGTHLTCAAVDIATGQLLPKMYSRAAYDHTATKDSILGQWAAAINSVLRQVEEAPLAGIGFAIPGPFDYRNGISRMKHKFSQLYDLHIPTALNPLLIAKQDLTMRFLNDATCFAMGEAWQGEGKPFRKVVVITLGTGFGSAFLQDGVPVVTGAQVPKEGCLWHLPFREGICDDYFSTRWFGTAYQKETGMEITGVKDLMSKAGTEAFVRGLFIQFGENLAECLAPWIRQFQAEILILGGNIAHALPLFESSFQAGLKAAGIEVPVRRSQLMERAALLGSARLVDDVFWEKVAQELPHL